MLTRLKLLLAKLTGKVPADDKPVIRIDREGVAYPPTRKVVLRARPK